MPSISIRAFSGLRPIVEPTLLGDGDAVVAQNARLVSGALGPLKGTTVLRSLTKIQPQTIFRYGDSSNENEFWLEFLADTDVMRSPIAADQFNRLYWADGGDVKYGTPTEIVSGASYPGSSWILGVPKPATAPAVTSFTAPPDASRTETRVYVYTYVSAYGEEGPPTDASSPVTLDPQSPAVVGSLAVGPGGNRNITIKRLYRSSTVGSSAQFQLVPVTWSGNTTPTYDIPVAITQVTDSASQAALGEILPSEEWDGPPTGLRGLKALANGAAIGFVGNTAYLSEPNLPHAWPHQYPVDAKIVGIGVFRQSAALLTNGKPYLLSGADPQAMSAERLELEQACVSKGSIVDTGDGVLYASPDGLVSIGSGGMEIVTSKLLSREKWREYNPSSIRGFMHDNRYHALYTTQGGQRGMLVFDFSGQGAALTTCDIPAATAITAGYSDSRSDTLYLAQGTQIVRFNEGSNLTYTWRSKKYRLPRPMSMSVGKVTASAYPVTLNVYADGALMATREVSSRETLRLPGGLMASDYELELIGASEVTSVEIASSMSELKAS